MAEKVLIPGDYVGPGEVYEEGASTYSKGDDIYASVMGEADESAGALKARSSTPALKPGDIVYGSVLMVMESFAIVIIYPEEKGGKLPASPPEGKIPVRAMSTGFTPSTRDAVRVGDIIRAKVVRIEGEKAELTMVDPNLGVIKAFCSQCREPLEKTSKGLVCPNGHRERREIANDYRHYGKILL
jgi:exosome complex component CSL4